MIIKICAQIPENGKRSSQCLVLWQALLVQKRLRLEYLIEGKREALEFVA
jgi:hypothetical protein